jgi:hypothetical protein
MSEVDDDAMNQFIESLLVDVSSSASSKSSPRREARRHNRWSSGEDEELAKLFDVHGPRWRLISKKLFSLGYIRSDDAIRNRCTRTGIDKVEKQTKKYKQSERIAWTPREDALLINCVTTKKKECQHIKWSALSALFPERTVQSIRNRHCRLTRFDIDR